jgi:hypothetical protein
MNRITAMSTDESLKNTKITVKELQILANKNDCYFKVKFEDGETGECYIEKNGKIESGGCADIGYQKAWYITPCENQDEIILYEHIGKDEDRERLKLKPNRITTIIEEIRFREVDPKDIKITSTGNTFIQLP